MTIRTHYLAAAAALGVVAVPAAAQYSPYPQAYPQTYPQQAYPGYAQPGYAYGQPGYGQQNPVAAIINQLLGNRYNVSDRTAVSQCASAAMVQAQAQYRGQNYYQQGYNNRPGYGGYGQNFAAPAMRVTAITEVERRNRGLRVKGLMSSGYGAGYGGQYGYGYQNNAYAAGDLSFRCNVDYRGAVTNVKISRNTNYRRN
jgi:hypothetical protein